jgi:lysophospholipase L1-like esterase
MAVGMIAISFTPRKITWVAIGDSITYLNEHPDETGNRITKGYMTRVVEKLPNVRYMNQGHNGWTSGGIAKEIDSLGIVKADVYSVFLGTNDWWAGRPVGQFTDYLTIPETQQCMDLSALSLTNSAALTKMPASYSSRPCNG